MSESSTQRTNLPWYPGVGLLVQREPDSATSGRSSQSGDGDSCTHIAQDRMGRERGRGRIKGGWFLCRPQYTKQIAVVIAVVI